jgi:hypothetical protein
MSTRSSSIAKPVGQPTRPGREPRSRHREEPPAARNEVGRAVVPAPKVLTTRSAPLIPASLRSDMIRDAAYFRAEARGFAPGKEIEDWLAAEQDVEELILRRYGR